MSGILSGKRGLIMGVANDHSIAWGIAQTLSEQGAELAFTYQGETLERRVRPLAESLGSKLIIPCDVLSKESMDNAFQTIVSTGTSLWTDSDLPDLQMDIVADHDDIIVS